MRRPLLVLVRWKGDIVATYDSVPPAAPLVSDEDQVRVEVYDVEAERNAIALGGRRRIEWLPIAAYAGSFLLHAGIAAVLLFVLSRKSASERDAEAANQQSATLQDLLTRIAANESTTAAAPEPPKEPQPEAPPVNPQAKPEPAPPPPKPDLPKPRVPKPEVAAAKPAEATANGSGGHDAQSTSPSVCSASKVGPGTGPMCHRSVVLGSISKRSSCYVDTVANAGDQGTLTYPCAGDGEATLTFGRKSFTGSVVGGKIDVCTGTEYPFSDGCTWSSAQRVSGSLNSGTLRFTYGESPKPGQQSCAQACGATATLRVEGGGNESRANPDTSL